MNPPEPPPSQEKFSLLQILILVLSIYVLGALLVQSVVKLSPEMNILLDRIDFLVCIVFLYDFFLRFYRADSKFAFLKWGWIDLVSSIPMLDVFRVGRAVRIIRIFRILRAFRSTKILVHCLFRHRAKSALATVASICFVLMIFSSIAMLNFETEPDSNIKTPVDALWWSFVTVTTVGYGDRYPITLEGRIVAAILMVAGVGLFGTFTGFVTSLFVEPEITKEGDDIGHLIREVQSLRAKIESLEGALVDAQRPNHAMQLTGSVRHGLCSRPADQPAQAAPHSACS